MQTRAETIESDEQTVAPANQDAKGALAEHGHVVPARGFSMDADIESLIQTLEVENRKKPLRFAVAVGATIAFTVVVQSVLSHFLHVHMTFIQNMWMVWIGVGAVFAPTRLQKATAKRLAQLDDIRAVGPLAEALDRQDNSTKSAASSAVARLLPRMKASDSALLNSRQRDFLLTGLKKGTRELKLAVLYALPQIGDERFLKEVTALSEGRGSAKRDAGLRDVAKDCLGPLQHIIETDRIRMTLLRPAESTPATEDILLRPAGSASGDDSVLLHPSTSPVMANKSAGETADESGSALRPDAYGSAEVQPGITPDVHNASNRA